MEGYSIGDTMFDPLEKKKKGKEKVPEMEFLKTLDPAEKEALLKSLEKQRKKKKKRDKAEKAKLKVQREENMKKAIDDFLAKHLTEQEYADHYKGKFDNVKKEVRNLLTSVSGIVYYNKTYSKFGSLKSEMTVYKTLIRCKE